MRLIFLMFAIVACGGTEPRKDPADAGNLGAYDAAATSALNCTPGAPFCEGQVRWLCTYSGHDASNRDDCGAQGKTCSTGAGCAVPAYGCCL